MATIQVRRGDPITAALLNDIASGRSAAGIRATGNISARQTASGQIQITGQFTGCFVGTVDEDGITARSGTTLGTGEVDIMVKDPATGDYVDSGLAATVDSVSSTASIPSGCWVTGFFQDDGTATLLNVDYGA
jgi:hypothetical protein